MIDDDLNAPDPSPVAESPSAPSAPSASEPAAPEKPAAEPSIDDDLRQTYRRMEAGRDESGRFVPKDGAPAKVEVASPEPVVVAPAVPPPNSWKAEARAEWDKLPPTVQEYVNQRETEAHKHISRQGEALAAYEPLGQAIGKHAHYIEQLGADPVEMIDRMFATSHRLDTNPVETIKELAQMYGVDLGQLAPDPFAEAPSREVSQLQAQVNQMRQHLAAQESQRQQYEQQSYQQTYQSNAALVEQFIADKPDIDTLGTDLLDRIKTLRAQHPQADPKQLLADAYDSAVWSNPQTRATRIEQQVAEKEKARIEAAKAAVAKAQGAATRRVGSVAGPSPDNLDTDLRSIWRKNNAA